MSQKIKERAEALASKEAEIKKKLLGQSKDAQSKINRIGKTALFGGIAALILYLMLRPSSPNSEAKNKQVTPTKAGTSAIIVDKVVTFVLAYLGRFLDQYLKDQSQSKKQEEK